jgi:hypothetical protein
MIRDGYGLGVQSFLSTDCTDDTDLYGFLIHHSSFHFAFGKFYPVFQACGQCTDARRRA